MSVDNDHINHIFFINEDEINRGKENPQKIFKNIFNNIPTYILDKNNEPIIEPSFVKYCVFMHTPGKREVGYDEINGIAISTVFLGFSHGRRNDAPILFETMVFTKSGEESFKERYTSYNDAKDGHSEAVKRARLESE